MELSWNALAVLGFIPLAAAMVPVWFAGRTWRRDVDRFQRRRRAN